MDFLTKREVCKKLGITERTFEKYVQEEGLPVIPITSHRKYVDRNELLEWLKKKQRLTERKYRKSK
jgi:excisionase family DNA binding protein